MEPGPHQRPPLELRWSRRFRLLKHGANWVRSAKNRMVGACAGGAREACLPRSPLELRWSRRFRLLNRAGIAEPAANWVRSAKAYVRGFARVPVKLAYFLLLIRWYLRGWKKQGRAI